MNVRLRLPARALSHRARVSAGLLILIAALPGTSLGAVTWLPNVDFGLRTDQPASVEAPANAWVGLMAPQLTLTQLGTITSLEITGRRNFDSRAHIAGPARAGDLAILRFVTSQDLHTSLAVEAQ